MAMKRLLIGLLIAWMCVGVTDASQLSRVPTLGDLTDVTVPTPSNNDTIKFNSTTSKWESNPDNPTEDYILLRDEKTSGTTGGTCTAGSWVTRALNTEVVDTGNHSSLASNQVTLSAGTYRIRASAPAFRTGAHQIRLQNVTDGTTVLLGTSEASTAASGENDVTRSWVVGRFTIASSKVFEIQHRCAASSSTSDFGSPTGFGTEVYTVVELWREGGGPGIQGFSGALVQKTLNQTLSNNVSTAVTWDTEVYDTDNWHDNVTNNTRLTVPAGVSRVRVCASADWVWNGTGTRIIELFKNGATFNGAFRDEIFFSQFMTTCSGPLEVTAGDFFEVFAFQNSGGNLDFETSTTSWFSIEAIP